MQRSIIVPVYQDQATLPELLQQIAVFSRRVSGPLEVVLSSSTKPAAVTTFLAMITLLARSRPRRGSCR